jgi:hypothetical protein
MEPITLITTAIALATPFLIKTGEKIAEDVGEDIWKVIKRPFSNDEQNRIEKDIQSPLQNEKVKQTLLEKIQHDQAFKNELESTIVKAQQSLGQYSQQNINNQGHIEKQVNVQNINGNVSL